MGHKERAITIIALEMSQNVTQPEPCFASTTGAAAVCLWRCSFSFYEAERSRLWDWDRLLNRELDVVTNENGDSLGRLSMVGWYHP